MGIIGFALADLVGFAVIGLFLIVPFSLFMAGRWLARRQLVPLADMFEALTRVETADRPLYVEEGKAKFIAARQRYEDVNKNSKSRQTSYDLNAWEQYIKVRHRELLDRDFKGTTQKLYDQMTAGDKTYEQLVHLWRTLEVHMHRGEFKLSDFGHPHNLHDLFLVECGAKALSVSQSSEQCTADPEPGLPN